MTVYKGSEVDCNAVVIFSTICVSSQSVPAASSNEINHIWTFSWHHLLAADATHLISIIHRRDHQPVGIVAFHPLQVSPPAHVPEHVRNGLTGKPNVTSAVHEGMTCKCTFANEAQ
jgi:hypothetical protein